jgi:hypothetical protein
MARALLSAATGDLAAMRATLTDDVRARHAWPRHVVTLDRARGP